jgi:hypothetical protein
MQESAIYLEHGLDPNTPPPLDADAREAAEIYGIRCLAIAKHAGAIACRAIGADALYRIVKGAEFPD